MLCIFSANSLVLVEESLQPLNELLPQYLFSQMNAFDYFFFLPPPTFLHSANLLSTLTRMMHRSFIIIYLQCFMHQ